MYLYCYDMYIFINLKYVLKTSTYEGDILILVYLLN